MVKINKQMITRVLSRIEECEPESNDVVNFLVSHRKDYEPMQECVLKSLTAYNRPVFSDNEITIMLNAGIKDPLKYLWNKPEYSIRQSLSVNIDSLASPRYISDFIRFAPQYNPNGCSTSISHMISRFIKEEDYLLFYAFCLFQKHSFKEKCVLNLYDLSDYIQKPVEPPYLKSADKHDYLISRWNFFLDNPRTASMNRISVPEIIQTCCCDTSGNFVNQGRIAFANITNYSSELIRSKDNECNIRLVREILKFKDIDIAMRKKCATIDFSSGIPVCYDNVGRETSVPISVMIEKKLNIPNFRFLKYWLLTLSKDDLRKCFDICKECISVYLD